MRFQCKLTWKKHRKSKEVENLPPPVVPSPASQPTLLELQRLELMFLEDMADAHYSLPVPRSIEHRFTARYLQAFECYGFVFHFEQLQQVQILVELLSHQAQCPTLPLPVEIGDGGTLDVYIAGPEDDNSVAVTLVSSPLLAPSDTIEGIYDLYANEISAHDLTLVDTVSCIHEFGMKLAEFDNMDVNDCGEDHKPSQCSLNEPAPSESIISENLSGLPAPPSASLAVVKYQPVLSSPHVVDVTPTPRRLRMSDFTIVAALGQGGFGIVLLVFDTISRRFFALKVIIKSNMSTKEMQYVFEEQRVGRALSGNKLLMCIAGSWEDSKNFFMLMPFAAGGDLGHHVRKHGPLSDDALAVVIPQLILAVEEIHGRRMINRDLKSANILLDTSNTIKIADFGLSVAFGVPRSDRPWKHKPALDIQSDLCAGTCGTPGYMAPEVIRGDKYSYSADIFSLGCVLYELIVGSLPFGGYDDLSPIAERYCTLPLEFPAIHRQSLDLDTQDLLAKMLDKSPATRITIQQIKEHPAFKNTDWTAVANGQVPANVRNELFTGTRPEDFDMSQAPSPPPGKPYEDGQEPHPWFHFAGSALTGPPADAPWVPAPRINPNSGDLCGSRDSSHLALLRGFGDVSNPRNLAVVNGSNLMSSDDAGARLVMNGSNLMSSDNDSNDNDPQFSNNSFPPTTPPTTHDAEIVPFIIKDDEDSDLADPSMASECAAFIQDLFGTKPKAVTTEAGPRRILLD